MQNHHTGKKMFEIDAVKISLISATSGEALFYVVVLEQQMCISAYLN